MKHYPHHIGDFIRDTARLTDAQSMAYLRLIWQYYADEAPLDNNCNALAFGIGANASDVELILKHFFFLHDGKWHQSRCDKVLAEIYAKSKSASESAKVRWAKREKNANALRTHCEGVINTCDSYATQNPIRKPKPSSSSGDDVPAGFEEFWSAYPKKVGKADAKRSWVKLKVNGKLPKVLKAISVQRRCEQWQKDGGQYIPNPSTWLNQGRWDDEVAVVGSAAPASIGKVL